MKKVYEAKVTKTDGYVYSFYYAHKKSAQAYINMCMQLDLINAHADLIEHDVLL